MTKSERAEYQRKWREKNVEKCREYTAKYRKIMGAEEHIKRVENSYSRHPETRIKNNRYGNSVRAVEKHLKLVEKHLKIISDIIGNE